MAQVTEELTEARVRAALKMIDGQAAVWRRHEVDDTADECETLAALARAWLDSAAAPPASPWQPIETAPRDGTHILVAVAGMPRSVGESYWWPSEAIVGGWQTWDGENNRRTVYTTKPTHWKPLDEPPAEEDGR